MFHKPSIPILFASLFILSWWILAFIPKEASHIPLLDPSIGTNEEWLYPLSPLSRETLSQALEGDTQLMAKMIADWDIEAQILQEKGVPSVQRLSHPMFLRSQIIGHILKNKVKETKSTHRFLPQTYGATHFLLALTDPEDIAALPIGFRNQKHFFSNKINKILLDIDPYCQEKLYLLHPEVAFVAQYSNIATLQALQSQNLTLFQMKPLKSLMDVSTELNRIGKAANKPLEAELLAIFIQAAIQGMDNRLLAWQADFPKRILYLTHFREYATPAPDTLIGEMLLRLGINKGMEQIMRKQGSFGQSLTLTKEQIIGLKPDCFILSVWEGDKWAESLLKEEAFSHLPAIRQQALFVVDERVQSSPSQFVVLAYFDLFQSLMRARSGPNS